MATVNIVNFVGFGSARSSGNLVPEEHSHRAPKQLIFPANPQWKIAGTINSTNTPSGKGWMSSDRGKITLFGSRLVVAIGRAKGVIIIVAEQLAFLETLLETVSGKRRFTRGQPALGQRQEFGNAAVAPRHFLGAQIRQ